MKQTAAVVTLLLTVTTYVFVSAAAIVNPDIDVPMKLLWLGLTTGTAATLTWLVWAWLRGSL